jgi:hypothetical protein
MPMMRSNRSRLLFVVASVAALLSLRAVSNPGNGREPATRALSIFSDVFALTRQNYVEPTDTKTLLNGAYDGMSDALDPFSYYVTASERAAYRAQEASGSVGPGIVVARRGGFPYVVAPLPGSPRRRRASIRATCWTRWMESLSAMPPLRVKGALDGPRARTSRSFFSAVGKRRGSPCRSPRCLGAGARGALGQGCRGGDRPRVQSHDGGRAAPRHRTPPPRDPAHGRRRARRDRRSNPDAVPAASLFAARAPWRKSSRARSPCSPSSPPASASGRARRWF